MLHEQTQAIFSAVLFYLGLLLNQCCVFSIRVLPPVGDFFFIYIPGVVNFTWRPLIIVLARAHVSSPRAWGSMTSCAQFARGKLSEPFLPVLHDLISMYFNALESPHFYVFQCTRVASFLCISMHSSRLISMYFNALESPHFYVFQCTQVTSFLCISMHSSRLISMYFNALESPHFYVFQCTRVPSFLCISMHSSPLISMYFNALESPHFYVFQCTRVASFLCISMHSSHLISMYFNALESPHFYVFQCTQSVGEERIKNVRVLGRKYPLLNCFKCVIITYHISINKCFYEPVVTR